MEGAQDEGRLQERGEEKKKNVRKGMNEGAGRKEAGRKDAGIKRYETKIDI